MITDLTKAGLLLGRLRRRRPSSDSDGDGIPVGVTNTGEVVYWPLPSKVQASHVTVLAASGAGKTILVGNALVQELLTAAEDDPPAVLLVDPKGDLVAAVLQGLAAEAPKELHRVNYLNPFDAGFPFNLTALARGKTATDIRATQLASLVAEISTATGAQKHLGVGARQVDVLLHVLLGAMESTDPRASVLWALDALTLPKGLQQLAKVTGSARARQFLSSAKLSDELKASTAARLRTAFAVTEHLERLVAAGTSVQFADLLAPGKLTLVDLGSPPGGLTALQEFWANCLVRLAVEFLMERQSPWKGHHCRVVVDEAQVVASVLADVAERVLTTGRSRGVSLVTLSQGTTLLNDASKSLLRVLLTNTPVRFIGRLAAPDAALLGQELAPGLGIDESASTVRARFSGAVTNFQDREFYRLVPGRRERFTSVDVDMAGWAEAAQNHAAELDALQTRFEVPASGTPRVTLANVAKPPEKKIQKPRSAKRSGSKWG